jgi:KUP system potassium uptake protein
MPFINFVLFILVVALVIGFKSSGALANAYGIAVSGTLATDTILFLVVLRKKWRKPAMIVALTAIVFVPVDLLFVTSNLQKLVHGGAFPIVISSLAFLIINTWIKGDRTVDKERRAKEGPVLDFIESLPALQPPLKRLPGAAVYIGHHSDFTPLALRATVEELHELPEKVVIITVQTTTAAHVPTEKRAVLDNFGADDGISHLMLYYGYHDTVNIPKVLKSLRASDPDLDFDLSTVAYFVSSSKLILTRRHNLAKWRKSLFYLMYRNEQDASDYYKLPVKQTEEMQVPITL